MHHFHRAPKTRCRRTVVAAVAAGAWAACGFGQQGAVDGEWRHHGGDPGFTRYSPLSQIDAGNFEQLEVAWRWGSADDRVEDRIRSERAAASSQSAAGRLSYEDAPAAMLRRPFPRTYFRGSPLMIKGRIYVPTELSQVAALDAGSGEELWVYDPKSYERPRPGLENNFTRGLEYWSDGVKERILIATPSKQLVSIDLGTGLPDPDFGEGGMVDLSRDLGRENINLRHISHGAPGIVVGDTYVIGSRIYDFPLRNNNPPGHVRAYDVRTGELRWRFNVIPQEGEDFVETWENESWKKMGNANVWAPLTADDELGYVYLATSTPTSDYYGGDRHGDNLFAESLVCVDVATGKRVWHFQTVHHGIWDYDIASAPNLIDVVVEGKLVKAVAQASKTAFTYVFDRVTGKPLWPIEERPVDYNTTVPGEKLARTQPFPTKPPPFDRQGFTVDDLIDFTPELRKEALEIASQYRMGPMFTPLILGGEGGKLATIFLPGAGGGAGHAGSSVDPATGFFYVMSRTVPTAMALVEPDPARTEWRYVRDRVSLEGPRGLPLTKPPYRRITAIDLKTGEQAWQVPLGEGPTNHPAIKHLDLGPLGSRPVGREDADGLLVTRTLLITSIMRAEDERERGIKGNYLQAFDKATGKLLAQIEADPRLHGVPATYLHGGRQYIVIAAGGVTEKAELMAFALPEVR